MPDVSAVAAGDDFAHALLMGFEPARGTEAPAIAGLQAGKPELGYRRPLAGGRDVDGRFAEEAVELLVSSMARTGTKPSLRARIGNLSPRARHLLIDQRLL